MGIDDEIVTILKEHIWVGIDKPKAIFNQKGSAFKKMPWIQSKVKDKNRPYTEFDLTGTFKRRQYPFIIEIRGVTDEEMILIQDEIEDAIESYRFNNGWFEINSEIEQEDSQGKLQSLLLEGFKILYK